MSSERQLTELEGAVLTEIAFRGNDTAYKVRRAFQLSPSVQWRGSAGAVSPAIHRLKAAGLVAATPHPKRLGQRLSLTAGGKRALEGWAAATDIATGVGLDPFRLRAGVWEFLSAPKRRALFAELKRTLTANLASLHARSESDVVDRRQTELAVALTEARLAWLARQSPSRRIKGT